MTGDKILLSKLNDLDISQQVPKIKWEVKFEVLALGGIKGYSINIPLMGEYKAPDLSKFDQVVKDLEDWIEARDLPFDKMDGGSLSFASMAVTTVAHALPDLPIDSMEMKSFMALIMAGCWLDDVFEDLGNAAGDQSQTKEVNALISSLYEVSENVWKGKYETTKDIPKTLPQLDVAFLVFFYGQQWAKSSIPTWNPDNVNCLTQQIKNTAKAMSLTFKPGYSENVAIETYRILRVYDSGYLPPYEFALLIKGIILGPQVRDNLLFKVIQDLSALSSAIANDIASLPKDLEKSFANNYVLLVAKKKSISLQQALDETEATLIDQIHELELALDQLELDFEDDEKVATFVYTSKNLYNGLIAYYSHTTRYGNKIKCHEPMKKQF